MVLVSDYAKNVHIGCMSCLDEQYKKANWHSSLFGWWGIPYGPFYTLQSYIFNNRMKNDYNSEIHNDLFSDFVFEHVDLLELGRKNSNIITDLLNAVNNH